MSRLRWRLPEAPGDGLSLSQSLMRRRGLGDASRETSHDPFQLAGMDRAVERLRRAIRARERILIFGDYDADGVTGTALLLHALRDLGARASARLPHRRRDGFGLRARHVDEAHAAGTTLLIAVDNGTAAFGALQRAADLGLETLVLDHHQLTGERPPALALLNPGLPGSGYPFPSLAAVGVVHKLLEALRWRRVEEGLDLVAVGTVADMAPLVGENRWLVQRGLERLNRAPRPGLAALLRLPGVRRGAAVDARCLGWQIGPRINSAGRLADPGEALELLLAGSEEQARPLAQRLDELNAGRRRLQQEAVLSARQALDEAGDLPPLVVVTGRDWHEGVVGLIAGTLAEDLDRPVVALTRAGEAGLLKGSARSVPGFDITAAIAAQGSLLTEFGGHAEAAGLTLPEENLPALTEGLRTAAARARLGERVVELQIDALARLEDLDLGLVDSLAALEPYGSGNPQPLLGLLDAPLQRIFELSGGKHLKLWFGSGPDRVEAVWWNAGVPPAWLAYGRRLDLAFEPERNIWNGRASLQLNLRALRPAGGEA
jgi:single-stranded-DNA-specific exonuclease